jgi:hypothetical protein
MDGTLRLICLDTPDRETFCTRFTNTLLGPAYQAVVDLQEATLVVGINGNGIQRLVFSF